MAQEDNALDQDRAKSHKGDTNLNQIAVNAKTCNSIRDLATVLATMVKADPHSYRQIARVGVFPEGVTIVLETTSETLRLADKVMSAALQGPAEPGAIYLGSIQRIPPDSWIYTADDARFGQYSARAELIAAVLTPYQEVTSKIAFASGNKHGQHAWLVQSGKAHYLNNEGVFDVVVVPENLGGGLVARTNRNGQQQTLLHLNAKNLAAGKVMLEAWTDLVRFDSPIVGIGLRFHGTMLTVTFKDGLEAVNCAQLAHGTVQRAEIDKQNAAGFMSVAGIDQTDLGLFVTQAGHAGGKARTVIARTTRNGLPAAQLQLAAPQSA